MQPKPVKKEGSAIFVASMLQSAQEIKEVKPQTRHDFVNEKDLEKTMAALQKGMVRKR